jgi:hypothetical protein
MYIDYIFIKNKNQPQKKLFIFIIPYYNFINEFSKIVGIQYLEHPYFNFSMTSKKY